MKKMTARNLERQFAKALPGPKSVALHKKNSPRRGALKVPDFAKNLAACKISDEGRKKVGLAIKEYFVAE